MQFISRWFLLTFFTISTIGSFLASVFVSRFGNAESELQTVYVQGFEKTFVLVGVFFGLCAVATFAYDAIPEFQRALVYIRKKIEHFATRSAGRYVFFAFASSAVVLFLLNMSGVLHGTFLIDDYEMYGAAMQNSVSTLLWTPINDHVIPIYWLELKTLFTIFNTNSVILNLPLYLAAVIAVGAAIVLLRQLGFGIAALVAFLAICATNLIVGHQIYGFYAGGPYFQVLAVFTLSLVCFAQARKNSRHSSLYLIASFVLALVCIFIESGGVWAPLSLGMFAVAWRLTQQQKLTIGSVLNAVKKEWVAIAVTIAITAVYVGYLVAIPYFSDEPFYGPERLPLSLATFYELYKVLTAGVLSSFFVPRFGLVISQPRFASLELVWHLGMFVLFAGTVLSLWWAWARGTMRTRVWSIYFLLMSLGTALLVAIARPSSHSISFYRDQNLLFSLFFISVMFVVIGYDWVHSASTGASKKTRTQVVIALCALIFAGQLVFSFYKTQYMVAIDFNRTLVTQLRETLTPAMNELSAQHSPLVVPALAGGFLGSSQYQLPPLSEFAQFIGIKNVTWVAPGRNVSTSSAAFADALRHDERLRAWYLASGEITETCSAQPFGTSAHPLVPGVPTTVVASAHTANVGKLAFDLIAQDAPEKIFLLISFTNEVGASGTLAVVRIDQYTPTASSDVRRYVCSVNLNDIPAYALSQSVQNIAITVSTSTPGTYTLTGGRFLQIGETLPGGTK